MPINAVGAGTPPHRKILAESQMGYLFTPSGGRYLPLPLSAGEGKVHAIGKRAVFSFRPSRAWRRLIITAPAITTTLRRAIATGAISLVGFDDDRSTWHVGFRGHEYGRLGLRYGGVEQRFVWRRQGIRFESVDDPEDWIAAVRLPEGHEDLRRPHASWRDHQVDGPDAGQEGGDQLEIGATHSRGPQARAAPLKRGVFRSVAELEIAIERFILEADAKPSPFVWSARPSRILAAVKRRKQALESIHSLVHPEREVVKYPDGAAGHEQQNEARE